MNLDMYSNPLISRYASKKMGSLFGSQKKFETWRKLWLALAESQKQLGLAITEGQLEEMRAKLSEIDFDVAVQYENKLRHDVMAHVHTFGDACPEAAPIIHLGATSCYVTDNTDLILFKEAMQLIANQLAVTIFRLATFAEQHKSLSCLGFTHLQPAQPTTIGKRVCLWIQDLVDDLNSLEFRLGNLKARGTKGTTGTQASFLKLFDGDHEKVKQLDKLVSEKIGFSDSYAVTGQTYPRKIDVHILDSLSAIAQSCHKIATDIRILASRKELEEPFEKHQIGSSAMAYKRNPMRSERICSLARFVISLQSSPANTLATQWLERTLDDSANRRLVLPQAFLAIDAILILMSNVADGMVVYPRMIEKQLMSELPFMASENIMMAAVEAGGNRQDLHEKIRQYSQQAGANVKMEGQDNNLLELLKTDPDFANLDFEKLMDPGAFIGRSVAQVEEFLQHHVHPLKDRYGNVDTEDPRV